MFNNYDYNRNIGKLNNTNTELISLHSNTISQTDVHLDRKILTINDYDRDNNNNNNTHNYENTPNT